jgi:DNA-binding YbaB/EbfC family protein
MNFDISKLMEQAKVLQTEFENSRKLTEQNIATGESGAGMVSVTINGLNKILSVKIADELMNLSEKKMLEDLIVAAVNNAVQNVLEENKKEMEKITSKLPNIPGLGNLL